MSRLTVIGLAQDKSDVIEALMKLGAVELETEQPGEQPDPAASEPEYHENDRPALRDWIGNEDDDFSLAPEDREHTTTLNAMSRLEYAIGYCRQLEYQAGNKASKVSDIGTDEFLKAGLREQEIMDDLATLEQTQLYLSDLKNRAAHLQTRHQLLLPWSGLDVDLSIKGTASTRVFLGSLDSSEQIAQLKAGLEADAPDSHLEIFKQDENHILIAVAVWKPVQDLVNSMLRRLNFHPMPLQGESGTAAELIKRVEADLEMIAGEIELSQLNLDNLISRRRDFEILHDFYLIRSVKLSTMKEISGSKSTFWLNGWVPTKLVSDVEKSLRSRFMVAVESRPAGKGEEHPILLHNPRAVKPYEVVVEMFSPPSVKDIDPAPILAPFFFFFFGMMLSDVGYGLILSLLCGVLIWKVKAGGELGRMARMLFISGIGSILWGFMFGGFFGDMLSVLSNGRINMPAIWFNPMDDPTKLMIWSMIFGVIHLFAGMTARIYILARSGKLKDGLLDIAPWYLIISGLGLMLGGIGGKAGQYLAIAGALVLLLFGGRDAKNPVVRLLKGLLSIYNITGYFSDILSYTRILALVLATSVIAMVVNLLGFLAGPTFGGIVLYIVVALAGHALNLALSALSAYVHTSRLQYVEFFSKFYEGGGRLWKPLRMKTRYINLIKNTRTDSVKNT
jgi:V/A-type H+-transporting ATPase subunit I